MGTRIQHYLHDSVNSTNVTCAVSSFNTTSRHTHAMYSDLPAFQQAGAFRGIIESIHIKLGSATGATQATIRLCLDAAGDFAVVPDTVCDLGAGVTTATSMCAALVANIPVFQILGGSSLYLFVYVDAGTPSLTASCITWSE